MTLFQGSLFFVSRASIVFVGRDFKLRNLKVRLKAEFRKLPRSRSATRMNDESLIISFSAQRESNKRIDPEVSLVI